MCEECGINNNLHIDNEFNDFALSFSISTIENTQEILIEEIRKHLVDFSEENQIRSLSDRIQRGLNVVGMLAIPELRGDIEKICVREGTTIEALQKMALDIQQNGVWGYSSELFSACNDKFVTILSKTEDEKKNIKTAKAYLILNKIDEIGGREADMTPEEFLTEFSRIHAQIRDVAENGKSKVADLNNFDNSMLEFINDCPVVHGNDFLSVVLAGRTSGVLQDKDGMLFIGSKDPIDLEVLTSFGLKKEIREDRGRKDVVIYVNEFGEEILKQLYPGFVIVLNKNLDLATNIATGNYDAFNNDTFCHKVFAPTSQSGDLFLNCPLFKDEIKERIFEQGRFKEILDTIFPKPQERELSNLSNSEKMTAFYCDLINIKGRQIVMDSMIDNAIRKLAKSELPADRIMFHDLEENIKKYEENNLNNEAKEKVQEILMHLLNGTEKVFEKNARQHHLRQTKKMEELERILSFSRGYISELDMPVCIQDMAGGAGDLGLAMAYEFMLQGKEFSKLQIIDPAPDLDRFFSIIIERLPQCYGFGSLESNPKLEFLKVSLQEATVSPDSFVIAKHPCGTLADEIIGLCRTENPKFMCMMTCCQAKAAKETAKYGFTQREWTELCELTDARELAKVYKKEFLEAQRIAEDAQDSIDSARYIYLSKVSSLDTFYSNEKVFYKCAPNDMMPKSHVLGFFRRDDVPEIYYTVDTNNILNVPFHS